MSTQEKIPSKADALIRAAGLRTTEARVIVLDTLLLAEYALSHQEIDQRLTKQGHSIDRVTLYRVLDWGLHEGLIHKLTGEDRVWRFNAAATSDHAHFYCSHCGQIYCLENLAPVVAPNLPAGFKLRHAELTIQGVCPKCCK